MVFVKVRETYDLATVQDKMTVIGIHTPKPDIIKKNYPGLLMQCRCYRPYSCDVRVACASMLPLDPLGVGTSDGAIAPEDVFNPILYKAMSNKGMSQLEARINVLDGQLGVDVDGNSAAVDVDTIANYGGGNVDQFKIYYGLLSQTNSWKHANPQSGLSMTGLKPLVYEMVYNIGDVNNQAYASSLGYTYPGFPQSAYSDKSSVPINAVLGKSKEFPYLNCTSYTYDHQTSGTHEAPGFYSAGNVINAEQDVPWLKCYVGAIIVPPSKLHQLFYRMVVEWTIEFTSIRPLSEITYFNGLAAVADSTHYISYTYSAAKEAITGNSDTIMENDSCMVSANVDVDQVM